jgi:hypothetical protein
MRYAIRRLWALALTAILTACGTSWQPGAAVIETSSVVGVPGAVFLPPIGPPVDTANFFPGAGLTIEVYAVQSDGTLGTNPAPLAVLGARPGDRYYEASWQVRQTADANPNVGWVRVLARATNYGGSAVARSCRGERACVVGSFDAAIRRGRATTLPGVLDLSDTRTLPVKVHLLEALNRPTAITELRRVSDGGPFVGFRNCIVNEFTLPGQGLHALGSGLHALGSVGGLFVLDPAVGMPGFRVVEPSEAGAWAAGLVGGEAAWSGAILIVDDFGPDGQVIDIGGALWPVFEGAPDPADLQATNTFLAAAIADGELSHGALVLRQTLDMLEAAGFVPVAAPSADFRVFASADEGFPYLVVAAVDIGGLDVETANVATRIQNALDGLQVLSGYANDDFAVQDVAINMSFVIVPCSILDDYETALTKIEGLATFDDYVVALGEDNAVALDFYEELKGLVLTPIDVDTDPLLQQFRSCEGSDVVARTPVVPLSYTIGSVKIEPSSGGGSYGGTEGPLTVAIDVREGPLGQVLDWSASHPIGTVFVKGGRVGSTYTYAGALSGHGLHAPVAPSGLYHDVSHVVFTAIETPPFGFLVEGAWRVGATWRDLLATGGGAAWDCGRGRLNHVASSGNYGLPYAMYPAAWDIVVAVSSQDAVPPAGFGGTPSSFSNAGEVMAPGALYALSRTSPHGDQVLAYAGTSFSAPVVSLFTALDLMRDAPACGTADRSLLSSAGDVENGPLPGAVATWCGP